MLYHQGERVIVRAEGLMCGRAGEVVEVRDGWYLVALDCVNSGAESFADADLTPEPLAPRVAADVDEALTTL